MEHRQNSAYIDWSDVEVIQDDNQLQAVNVTQTKKSDLTWLVRGSSMGPSVGLSESYLQMQRYVGDAGTCHMQHAVFKC